MRRGYPLGKITVNRFAIAQALVEIVGHNGGALFRTGTTAGTFGFIHISLLAANRHFEITGLAFDLFDVAVGHQVDIGMSTDIQHLR